MQAIQSATILPAQVMKQDKTSGSIKAGKKADLLILDADPLASIRNIRKVNMVFKEGQAYQPHILRKMVGFANWSGLVFTYPHAGFSGINPSFISHAPRSRSSETVVLLHLLILRCGWTFILRTSSRCCFLLLLVRIYRNLKGRRCCEPTRHLYSMGLPPALRWLIFDEGIFFTCWFAIQMSNLMYLQARVVITGIYT